MRPLQKILLAGLFLSLGARTLQSAPAAQPDNPAMKHILVLGDSLSDGYPSTRSHAYPALLTAKLRAAGLDFDITNVSQPGGTTTDGLRSLPKGLSRQVDIFILELGVNDIFRGRPIEEIEKNLQEIIDRVKAKNPAVRVVILGLQLPNHSGNDFVSAFGKMYSDLAASNNAAYLPYLLKGVSGNPLLNSGDGVHPNFAGHKVMARNVWEVLEPVAREVAASLAPTEPKPGR